MDFCSATNQMSAIATKKAGGDVATQLTFPAVFQDVYASQYRPLAYAPSAPGPLVTPMAGDDFQSHYHAQKKKDADYMANAKVIATRNARRRMLLSHQNYYGMPDPVLAQREFANGSAGALILNSARQTNTTAPFQLVESSISGGVLRTAEGQAYGKARLTARIQQLDAIDAEKERFLGVAPPPTAEPLAPGAPIPPPTGAPVTQNARIELQLLLQSIVDALMGERGLTETAQEASDELSRFTFGDSVRALSLVIRVASSPDTDAETLEDVLAPVDNIVQLLEGLTDPDRVEQVEVTAMGIERLITTKELFLRINEYLRGMMEGINLSPRERLALSKNLVKSLGFAKFTRDIQNAKVESRALYERIARSRLFDERGRQEMDDEDDDDDDDGFDGPAERREDTEQGSRGPRSAFTGDERQVFGYASGDWFGAPPQGGRDAPAYLGETRPAVAELGEVEAPPPVPRATPSVRSRASAAPSAEIRGVYDPVLGARGVEVVRPASVRSRPASARSVGPVRESRRILNLGTPSARVVPGSRTIRAQGRVVPPPPSVAPSRRSRTSVLATSARGPRAAGGEEPLPTRQSELPTTREGFVRLAEQINARGGIDGKPLRVYAKGTLESVRRNFIRRLGLVGKP